MIRPLSLAALAALLGACTTPASGGGPAPLTPTSRYQLQAHPVMQDIALAPRADGLSAAQRAALGDIARRANGQPIVIRAPAGGDEVAMRSAYNVRAELEALGAPGVRLASYDAPNPAAPILVGFTAYEAEVPRCGTNWTNLTATRDNQSYANFGCAVTANLAAQIADPADIAAPRPLDPADAARRSVVLGKYRAGEVTSAEVDENASGAVSRVVP